MAVVASRARRFPGLENLEGRALTSADLGAARAAAVAGPRHAHVAPRLANPGAASPGGVRAYANLVYTNVGGPQHLDLYVPTTPAPAGGRPVILALPGGGWRWVRRSDLGVTVSSFAKDGYVVAVADYAFSSGQAGSKVWPTNVNDVRDAVRWLKVNAGRYGIDPNRVAVWGESAGGHLAALVGTDPDGPTGPPTTGKFAGVSAKVKAVVDFYGPADLTALYGQSSRAAPYLLTFLGGRPDQVPDRYRDASPVNHVSPGDPPFLIFQGTADAAVPPAQSAALDAALTAAGVPHQVQFFNGLGHGFRLSIGPLNLRPTVSSFLNSALNRGTA